MKIDFRTVKRAISTLVVLCVLVLGMSFDVAAQGRGRGLDWGRSHNRGRHLGWERGRRVGQFRRDDDDRRRRWRRYARRDRRHDRRTLRRQRRLERRSDWGSDRNWRTSRYRQSGDWRNRY